MLLTGIPGGSDLQLACQLTQMQPQALRVAALFFNVHGVNFFMPKNMKSNDYIKTYVIFLPFVAFLVFTGCAQKTQVWTCDTKLKTTYKDYSTEFEPFQLSVIITSDAIQFNGSIEQDLVEFGKSFDDKKISYTALKKQFSVEFLKTYNLPSIKKTNIFNLNTSSGLMTYSSYDDIFLSQSAQGFCKKNSD